MSGLGQNPQIKVSASGWESADYAICTPDYTGRKHCSGAGGELGFSVYGARKYMFPAGQGGTRPGFIEAQPAGYFELCFSLTWQPGLKSAPSAVLRFEHSTCQLVPRTVRRSRGTWPGHSGRAAQILAPHRRTLLPISRAQT